MDQRGRIERARRGEHDAFTELVDVHLARLDAAARLILRDPELARDAVQEALIRAWRDLPGLRDPDRFEAWLHRLIVNACLDLIRHRKRRVIEGPTSGSCAEGPWLPGRGQGRTPGWSGPGVQEKALVAGTGFEPVTFGL